MENHHPHAGNNKNMMAVFSYLSILILIPLLTGSKDEPFVKYHLKQGLVLVIFEAVGWLLNGILVWIPVVGWMIMWLWWLASIVFALIGIVNVMNGQEKELPFIGEYAKGFKF